MIKEYKKKDGSKAYMFVAYLGVDPLTGKQKRTTRRGFKTKRDAKIAEARLQAEMLDSHLLNNNIISYKEVYNLWMNQYKNTVRTSTLLRVECQFKKQILPKFGHLPIRKITVAYCQKVVNEWVKTYASAKNLQTYTSLIFEYALKINVTKFNPFSAIQPPKIKKEVREETELYYTKDELKQFLSLVESDIQYHTMFRILAFTGLRRGELLALTWDDIDLNKETLTVSKTLAQNKAVNPPKTKKSARTISLDKTTINILRKWKHYQISNLLCYGFNANKPEQLVFSLTSNNKHMNLDCMRRKIKEISKKYNFKEIKVHGFRHTHCSLLFESGATIQEVQERLGHEDIKTTMNIYAHVTEKQRDQVADKFANYVNF